MVLVGLDQAPALAELRLPRRAEVYLLTETGTAPEAHQWSVPLGAAVVVVPGNARWLSGAIADLSRRPSGSGQRICVTGGAGGVGASTLAAGLAFVAARSGRPTALVDLDPGGGGIDLLIGAERLDGWRWPRLVAARGHLGDFGDQLPCVDGVEVLSMGRGVEAVATGGRSRAGRAWVLDRQSRPDRGRRAPAPGCRPAGTAVDGRGVVAVGSRRPPRSGLRAGALSGRWQRSVSGPVWSSALAEPGCSTRRASPTGSAPTCTPSSETSRGCCRPPSGATHRDGPDAVRSARWPDGCWTRSGAAWTPPGPSCPHDPARKRRPRAAPGPAGRTGSRAYAG